MPPTAITRHFNATALADSLPYLKGGVRRGAGAQLSVIPFSNGPAS
jgi:hypothetical protein